MNNKKVLKLVDRIEADLRQLAEITGSDYISAFIVDGAFNMDNGNTGNDGLDVFRKGVLRNFTYGGKRYE